MSSFLRSGQFLASSFRYVASQPWRKAGLDLPQFSQQRLQVRLYGKPSRFQHSKKYIQINNSKTRSIELSKPLSVSELAALMSKSTEDVYSCLEDLNMAHLYRRESSVIQDMNVLVKILQMCGFKYSIKPKEVNFDELEAGLKQKEREILKSREAKSRAPAGDMVRRPPVVTIMGHVDHGKTTLLDSLRGSNVVEKEFGGITQHIGAFNVKLNISTNSGSGDAEAATSPRNITFLDTPGHAAFSTMRSRGAKVTDVVVLVIAAEDGVMAQTVESIEHAKNSGCPIIVAINKIDKANEATLSRVKSELLKYQLIPEEMGGDVQVVPISALQKTNLERLKEEIWARAEVMELKGSPSALCEGFVIESTSDKHKGKLATVLVQNGTLKRGDYLVAGSTWCKVKTMFDENGQSIDKATLSQAVQIMGWKELPHAGDEVLQMETENDAKSLVVVRGKLDTLMRQRADHDAISKSREEYRKIYRQRLSERQATGHNRVTMTKDDAQGLTSSVRDKFGHKTLPIIVKADVDGSLEAILNVIETYNPEENKVLLDLVSFEVGTVKPSDLELADTFDALIYCFNLPPSPEEQKLAEARRADSAPGAAATAKGGARIKHFNVIYALFDDIIAELEALAPYYDQEETVGEASVKKLFEYSESNKKKITVVGGQCTEGLLDSKLFFKIVRGDKTVADGLRCQSLKHLKNEVPSIKRNVEFGISFDNQEAAALPEPGDKIVCYSKKAVKSKINWTLGF